MLGFYHANDIIGEKKLFCLNGRVSITLNILFKLS